MDTAPKSDDAAMADNERSSGGVSGGVRRQCLIHASVKKHGHIRPYSRYGTTRYGMTRYGMTCHISCCHT